MSINVQFGRALQHVRLRRGVTQEDFAMVSSRTYISTLERGLKSPTLEKIGQLAGRLGIHPLAVLALAYAENDEAVAARLLSQTAVEISELYASENPKRRSNR